MHQKNSPQLICGALVELIEQDMHAPGLRGLATAYADAMSAAGGLWSVLSKLQGGPRQPIHVLRRIDDIAKSTNKRYVLWIEDLERFAGLSSDAPDQETARQRERLAPVRAAVSAIEQLESVTVVTASTALVHRFDLEKIARFIEELPELGRVDVLRVLRVFREGCLAADIIDPAAFSVREGFRKGLNISSDYEREQLVGNQILYVVEAVAELCRTPRTLKQALRSCLEYWEQYPGEIDFDDLIVLNVLRHGQPEAFAVLADGIHALRGYSLAAEEDLKEARKEFLSRMARVVKGERERRAVLKIIESVFTQRRGGKPQGAMCNSHANYWRRFLLFEEISDAKRDQPILRVLSGGSVDDIVAVLVDASRCEAIYDFRELLEPAKVVDLLVPLVRSYVKTRPNYANEHALAGLVVVLKILRCLAEDSRLASGSLRPVVIEALDIAVPVDLMLATEIERYFATSSSRVHLLDGAARDEAKVHFRRVLVRSFAANPERLLDATAGAQDPVLLWITWGIDRVRDNDLAGLPFGDWSSFAGAVLKTAGSHPSHVLPMVAYLVTRRVGGSTDEYQFDSELAELLFHEVEELLRMFRDFTGSAAPGSPLSAVLAAVRTRG